jgi:dipeptide/tripeptide permease
MILLLPKRETNHPEMGKLVIDPTGNANSNPPSAASLKPNCCLILGILLAQLAKQIPAMKKKLAMAIRWVLGLIIASFIGAKIPQFYNFPDLGYICSPIG